MGLFFSKRRATQAPPSARNGNVNSARTSWGHSEAVTALAFVSDTTLISANKNSRMLMAEWSAPRLVREWTWRHDRGITRVIVQNGIVASAGRDGIVALRRAVPTGQEDVTTLTGHTMGVMGIAFSPDGSQLVSGARDGDIRLWDVASTRSVRETHLNRNVVTSVKWVPGSSNLLQSSEDKSLRVWDSRSLSCAIEFPRQQYILSCCDAANDGHTSLTGTNGFGGQGCVATLWDSRNPRAFVTEFREHQESITECLFAPNNNNIFATSSLDSTVRIWQQDRQQSLSEYTSAFSNFTSLAMSPGQNQSKFCFAAGTNAGLVDVVNVDLTNAEVARCTQLGSF